jgi:hypothetical protein
LPPDFGEQPIPTTPKETNVSNATAITVRDLTGNGSIPQPAPDTLDTGTAAVTLPLALSGTGADRTILEVHNAGSGAITLDALDGQRPSPRAGIGDLNLTTIAAGATEIVGPFEGGRFGQSDGRVDLRFTPASGTIGASIRAYRLPKTIR